MATITDFNAPNQKANWKLGAKAILESKALDEGVLRYLQSDISSVSTSASSNVEYQLKQLREKAKAWSFLCEYVYGTPLQPLIRKHERNYDSLLMYNDILNFYENDEARLEELCQVNSNKENYTVLVKELNKLRRQNFNLQSQKKKSDTEIVLLNEKLSEIEKEATELRRVNFSLLNQKKKSDIEIELINEKYLDLEKEFTELRQLNSRPNKNINDETITEEIEQKYYLLKKEFQSATVSYKKIENEFNESQLQNDVLLNEIVKIESEKCKGMNEMELLKAKLVDLELQNKNLQECIATVDHVSDSNKVKSSPVSNSIETANELRLRIASTIHDLIVTMDDDSKQPHQSKTKEFYVKRVQNLTQSVSLNDDDRKLIFQLESGIICLHGQIKFLKSSIDNLKKINQSTTESAKYYPLQSCSAKCLPKSSLKSRPSVYFNDDMNSELSPSPPEPCSDDEINRFSNCTQNISSTNNMNKRQIVSIQAPTPLLSTSSKSISFKSLAADDLKSVVISNSSIKIEEQMSEYDSKNLSSPYNTDQNGSSKKSNKTSSAKSAITFLKQLFTSKSCKNKEETSNEKIAISKKVSKYDIYKSRNSDKLKYSDTGSETATESSTGSASPIIHRNRSYTLSKKSSVHI